MNSYTVLMLVSLVLGFCSHGTDRDFLLLASLIFGATSVIIHRLDNMKPLSQ